MSPPRDQHRRFVAALEKLVSSDNRAALAALRRGLGKTPGEVAEVHRYVVPWLPNDTDRWREDAYYLVASLFASHQRNWVTGEERREATNLGASFARLMGVDGSQSVERRFVALLNSHADDLPEHLRSAVGLLKASEVLIDWTQLLGDIQGWGWESRAVQRAWARAFWGSSRLSASETGESVPAASSAG